MYYGRYLQSGSSKTKFKLTCYYNQVSSLAFVVSNAISQLVIAKQTIDEIFQPIEGVPLQTVQFYSRLCKLYPLAKDCAI